MPDRRDDPTIADGDILLRRIVYPSNQVEFIAEDRSIRLNSSAFKDGRDEVSVHQLKLTTVASVLEKYPEVGIVKIRALDARNAGHIVVNDPQQDDPSHALVCPQPSLARKQRDRNARTMRDAAIWVKLPKAIREMLDLEEELRFYCV